MTTTPKSIELLFWYSGDTDRWIVPSGRDVTKCADGTMTGLWPDWIKALMLAGF